MTTNIVRPTSATIAKDKLLNPIKASIRKTNLIIMDAVETAKIAMKIMKGSI